MRRMFLLLLFLYLIEFFSLLLLMSFSNNLNPSLSLHCDADNVRVPFSAPLVKRVKKRVVHDVDCRAILKGDEAEIKRAVDLMARPDFRHSGISDNDYIQMTKHCVNFRSARGYNDYNPSPEEVLFPVAYSVLLYKDVEQTERLLRAIYAPHNYYCLHVDADAEQAIHDAVEGIASCFHNVFVVSKREYIVYAGFTRLQAEINCMEQVLYDYPDWRYYINLPSQEFPLKTNKEIVRILKMLRGANDISGLTGYRSLIHRYKHRFIYRHINDSFKAELFETHQEKENPPFNITLVKGSAYGIFSREFVEFATSTKIARELLFYLRDVYSPDEYFWATLNFNRHLDPPGSFLTERPEDKPYLTVFASWFGLNACKGKFVRRICVYGVGDLQNICTKHHLFANKFHLDYQPLALDCLEEWHLNRTIDDRPDLLNMTFYETLNFAGP